MKQDPVRQQKNSNLTPPRWESNFLVMNWAENKFSVPRVASERKPPSAIQIERYSHAATHEIQSGNLRKPIWLQALADTDGDKVAAEARYLQLRVQQIAEDEARWTLARAALRRTRQFNDSLAVSPLKKRVLLAAGILLAYALFRLFSE
ncbi:MAG: hypothetical protein AAB676_12160 [Verrucomicrobiota bacterium]